jgi:hypothetical protein
VLKGCGLGLNSNALLDFLEDFVTNNFVLQNLDISHNDIDLASYEPNFITALRRCPALVNLNVAGNQGEFLKLNPEITGSLLECVIDDNAPLIPPEKRSETTLTIVQDDEDRESGDTLYEFLKGCVVFQPPFCAEPFCSLDEYNNIKSSAPKVEQVVIVAYNDKTAALVASGIQRVFPNLTKITFFGCSAISNTVAEIEIGTVKPWISSLRAGGNHVIFEDELLNVIYQGSKTPLSFEETIMEKTQLGRLVNVNIEQYKSFWKDIAPNIISTILTVISQNPVVTYQESGPHFVFKSKIRIEYEMAYEVILIDDMPFKAKVHFEFLDAKDNNVDKSVFSVGDSKIQDIFRKAIISKEFISSCIKAGILPLERKSNKIQKLNI